MVVVGILVRNLIATSVTQNSAAATALYVDSVIAPLLPDMRAADVLDETVAHALDETLGQGALGRRLYSFRLWRKDGTILYSKEKDLVGKTFPPSDDLARAFTGELVANFDAVDDPESEAEIESGQPLLEIYNPVLQPWSGEVVAVSEFYEVAPDFRATCGGRWCRSWLAVVPDDARLLPAALRPSSCAAAARSTAQSRALEERVGELSDLLAQNRALRLRVQRASQRATALNERYLRRIGADLHDGPAQLVALAALGWTAGRWSAARVWRAAANARSRAIKSSLDEAMREIRSICNGLVLPHIEAAELAGHTRAGGAPRMSSAPAPRSGCRSRAAAGRCSRPGQDLHLPLRAGGAEQRLPARRRDWPGGRGRTCGRARSRSRSADSGPGFDPAAARPDGLGLAGLTRAGREPRRDACGIETSAEGTTVRMSLECGGNGAGMTSHNQAGSDRRSPAVPRGRGAQPFGDRRLRGRRRGQHRGRRAAHRCRKAPRHHADGHLHAGRRSQRDRSDPRAAIRSRRSSC